MKPAGTERRSHPAAADVLTMRAIVQDCYDSDPERVLRLEEVARPAIGYGREGRARGKVVVTL